MTYNQEITLDLNTSSAVTTVNAKQGDVDSRVLLVHYTANGEQYLVNHNNSVALRMRKPDGKVILNDATINNDGTVTVTFSYQCLVVAGRAYADLVEFNSAGQVLSTVSFIVDIMKEPNFSYDEALSTDEFLYLKSFIDRGNAIIGEAQKWANGYDGDTPVPISDPAYHNNAKFYKEALENIEVEATDNIVNPGEPGSVIKTYDDNTNAMLIKLGLPCIKPSATVSVTTGNVPSGTVTISNVGSGETAALNKNFDFSLVIPKGEAAGFANDAGCIVNVLPSGSAPTVSVAVDSQSDDKHKKFNFIFGIPSNSVRGINDITLDSDYRLTFSFSDGTSKTLSQPIIGPSGPQGAPGATGSAGKDGKTAASGALFAIGSVTYGSSEPEVILSSSSSGGVTTYSFDFALPYNTVLSFAASSSDPGDLIITQVT